MMTAPSSITFTPQRQRKSYWVLKVYLAAAVLQLGIMGFCWWTRSFLHRARTSEAPSTLTDIGRAAKASFARDGKMCPSATKSVPADLGSLPGLHRSVSDGYQSMRSEWLVDEAAHAGFACLEFEVPRMQHFGYSYESTPTSFIARAVGDAEYTGKPSTFEIRGVVKDGVLVVSDPEETTR